MSSNIRTYATKFRTREISLQEVEDGLKCVKEIIVEIEKIIYEESEFLVYPV